MRLAFMGSPHFACPSLSALVANGHEVVCVYSQPPAPKGRGQILSPSPLHELALTLGIDVRTPITMKAPEAIDEFQSLDIDALIVVAYGQILKQEVLDHPRLGCFNLHGSLLPRWRGAAPIQRALMAGDRMTGVEIMRMSVGLDEGPVLMSAQTAIEADDTYQSLHDRLAIMGADLWPVALGAIERGCAVETQQVGDPCYARKISNQEARIDWSKSAMDLDHHIRGLSPFPGAYTMVNTPKGPQRLKVLMSRTLKDGSIDSAPGTYMGHGFRVATGEGIIELLRVQREGKSAQSGEDFLKGAGLEIGDRFE